MAAARSGRRCHAAGGQARMWREMWIIRASGGAFGGAADAGEGGWARGQAIDADRAAA
jgi:hypothetical protein